MAVSPACSPLPPCNTHIPLCHASPYHLHHTCPPPPRTESETGVKTLPSRNFVCGRQRLIPRSDKRFRTKNSNIVKKSGLTRCSFSDVPFSSAIPSLVLVLCPWRVYKVRNELVEVSPGGSGLKFLCSQHMWVQKVQQILLHKVRFECPNHFMVSPPLNLYSQNDKLRFIGPHQLPKVWGKKQK